VASGDGGQNLRISSRFPGDSNPLSGTTGFDEADFNAHKATVSIGTADNFDFTVGDYSNTSATYLALYGISFTGALLATLGNFVFEDTNGNGLQDVGEAGIAGVTVSLRNSSGNIIATQSTDSLGFYSFTNLVSGQYSVQFGAPSGYVATAANQGSDDSVDSDADPNTGITAVVNLAPGEVNNTVDAGFYKLASLGDFVWNDTNANGIQDPGEAGISGVTVRLLDGSGNDLNRTTTTNANGGYSFTGLTPGSYSVQFVAPSGAGYLISPRDQGGNDSLDSDADTITGKTGSVTLVSGENNTSLDAGLYKLASLGDFVWYDTNANGIQDAGEAGISGVTVSMRSGVGMHRRESACLRAHR
jgi:hypothetical protein